MAEMTEEEADALDELWTKLLLRSGRVEAAFLLNVAPECCCLMKKLYVFWMHVREPHTKPPQNLFPNLFVLTW